MNTENIIPGMFDIQKAVIAQAKYCDENEFPLFAPVGGCCWGCGKNIYAPIHYGRNQEYTSGITVKRAGSELITACPHCNHSFVD